MLCSGDVCTRDKLLKHTTARVCVCVCYLPQIAQLDEAKIRISALRAIIDLLLLFGFQLLSEAAAQPTAAPAQSPERQEEDAGATEEKGDAPEDSAQSILLMLSDFLDSEVSGVESGETHPRDKKKIL